MTKKVLGYKIRNSKTGLYASSLYKNKWSKTGKTWARMCDVVRAINFGSKYAESYGKFSGISKEDYKEFLINNIEIVELTEENSYSVMYLINKIK
tara:strand:- start:1006 stop:1290 length:285 start_codon:yes stop_codon:yes gene_type:complete